MSYQRRSAFTISIFVPDGNPEGLKIVEKTNWTGKAVVSSRSQFPEVRKRPEFEQTGVYLLIGTLDTADLPVIYVGEGDPVKPRLDQHFTEKDFWTWSVLFTSKNLNKAHVQYLEARLVALAKEAKRCELDNANNPQLPTLSESDEAWMEGFLGEMLSIYPILGLSVFETPSSPPPAPTSGTATPVASSFAEPTKLVLYIRAKGLQARGFEAPEGFVVAAGSYAVQEIQPSMPDSSRERRETLIKQGVLVNDGKYLKFTQDYTFGSPSGSADVILGSSVNGRTEWKDIQGRTLKQLQALAVGRTV